MTDIGFYAIFLSERSFGFGIQNSQINIEKYIL